MAELKNTGTWRYIKLILWVIETLSILIILGIEMYVYFVSIKMDSKNNDNKNKLKSQKNRNLVYHLTNILPIISYMFYGLNGCFVILDIGNMFSCYLGGVITLTAYMMGKSFMYLLFIYRLHVVYAKSVFKYNQWILVGLLISIVSFCVAIIIANAFTLEASSVDINGIRFCGVTIAFPVLAVGAVFDLSITTMCCILFIRPLRTLTKMNNKANYKITKLVYKYALLTFVSVTTTLVVIILIIITDLEAIGSIDIIINCLCLMMFNDYHHKKMFNIICYCPICINILPISLPPEIDTKDSNTQNSDTTATSTVSSTKSSIVEGCIKSIQKGVSVTNITQINIVNNENEENINNASKNDTLIQQEYMKNQKDLWHLTKGHIKPNEFKTSGNITSNNGEASIYLSEAKL